MALQEVFSTEAAKLPDDAALLPVEKAAQLFAAIAAVDRKAVRKLLEEGVSPNVRDEKGNTPLMAAVRSDSNLTIAGMLLGRGADIHAVNAQGETALHVAFNAGVQMLRLMLSVGADPLVINDNDKRENMIFHAVTAGNEKAVDALLGAGIKPTVVNTNSETLLNLAAQAGDVALVKKFIDLGVNPNQATAKGVTPLRSAMWNQNPALAAQYLDCINLILKGGADPSCEQAEKHSNSRTHVDYNLAQELGGDIWAAVEAADKKFQITRAAKSGVGNIITNLLQQGVAPDAVDRYGYTAVQYASGFNLPAEIKALIDAGADPKRLRPDDRTPLTHAAKEGEAANIPVLVVGGADPNAYDGKGRSPLTGAVLDNAGNAGATVKALCDAKADPNLPDKTGDYALAIAARTEDFDAMSALITAGAKVDLCLNKQTALLSACSAEDEGKCAILLLENGADPNIVAEQTSSPLLVAALSKNSKLVEALLAKGALPDTVCDVGVGTALMQASEHGDAECIKLLLAAKADPNLGAGPYGRSPLHSAVLSGNLESVQLLIAAGATTFAKDGENKTPFDCAEANKKNYEIFEAVAARRDDELNHWAEDSVRTTGSTSGMKKLKFKPKAPS
ncbi:MAG: ankyrin repeat domain-containing protein [Alphaproteobacteria bacterium]